MKLFNPINIKYWIYPIVIMAIVLILALFHINSSSVGMYRLKLFPQTQEDSIIFGSPRAIRSDQYLVEIPTLVSQDINDEPLVNKDMADGTNLGINLQPTKSIFSIFRPSVWIFFLSNNVEFNFSFYWWTKFALLLISTYLLLLEITKKNLLLSISGSILFFFTPFIQWWIPVDSIVAISFGLFFFSRLIKGKDIKSQILWGLGLAYWITTFALVLYPAFQIPMMYAAIFIALGIVIQKRKTIFSDRENIARLILILIGSVVITGGFLAIFFREFDGVIQTMMNTVYPGARFMSAGQGVLAHLTDGFYNILMQRDSNGAPFGNQSEASNFFMLYIPLLVWVIYKNISLFIQKKKIDWLGISISLCLVWLTVWYLFPLPDLISRYTGMYMVLPQRIFIGIGFANYILIFYMISKKMYRISKEKALDWIISITLLLVTGLLMYLTGKILYNYDYNPNSFLWPEFVSPTIKILLVTVFVPGLLGLLLLGYKKLFLGAFLFFAILSTIYINPIYKGLGILIDTDLAHYINQLSTQDDSKWMIYGNHYFAQYALANNASVINGIHMYPQFEMWKILDSEKKYEDIYNRYAHIMVSEYTEGEDLVRLTEMDAIELNINACDSRLKQLDLKYVLSIEPMTEDCLKLLRVFGNNEVYIYTVN